jgi:RDD family protein/FHA domain-containing protein
MPGALLGAASCSRCGQAFYTAEPFCSSCGVRLAQPAAGSVVGSYSGLLVGVSRSGPARGNLALAVDLLPLAMAAAVAVIQALGGGLGGSIGLVWTGAFALCYVVAEVVALTRRGSSLGRLLFGLRTVDDLTGDPISVRRFLRQLGTPDWTRQVVTADLARGRDPLDLTLPPVRDEALRADGLADAQAGRPVPRRALPVADQTTGRFPTTAAPTVTLVVDSGRRQVIHDSLLIGRSPENRGGDHALLAVPDLSRTLSKTHALLEWSGAVLWVTDLGSANGSVLISPDGERQPLVPGLRGAAAVGWTVQCGGRTFAVRAAREAS